MFLTSLIRKKSALSLTGDYAGLVERRRPGSLTPGPIVDESGKQLGVHEGHQHFTIGQRRGLGVALGHPVFVVDRIPATNTVVVGPPRATGQPRALRHRYQLAH